MTICLGSSGGGGNADMILDSKLYVTHAIYRLLLACLLAW
jgi:hypothetical protein